MVTGCGGSWVKGQIKDAFGELAATNVACAPICIAIEWPSLRSIWLAGYGLSRSDAMRVE